jgi:DNA-binding MarR family transcriptional regulator
MSAEARLAPSGTSHEGQAPAGEAWRLLYELLKSMQGRWSDFVQSSGLTPVQVQLLHEIATAGPTPMRGLASRLGVDPSWITGLVHQLEQRGFVQRHASPTDRRIKIVRLTERGEASHREWQRVLHSPPDGLEALSAEDTRELIRILRRTLRLQGRRGAAQSRV